MSNRHALLVGATGLVGKYLLVQLLSDSAYDKVTVLSRQVITQKHPKLATYRLDFDNLADYQDLITGADMFCCLGTTRKAAGSRAAFEKVDFDYVHELATLAEKQGVKQFLMISAVGANPKSPFFYNAVKGRIEEAVNVMRFRSIHILRPSLLLGPRSERRPGEQIANKIAWLISPLLLGKLRRYRPVHARVVAETMIRLAKADVAGVRMHYFPVPDPWPPAEESEAETPPAASG